jgi:hypothetical protein
MQLFLAILFILGFFHTAINLSLFSRKRNVTAFVATLSALIFVLFPLSIRLNIEALIGFLGSFHTLSSICTYQIIESIVIMLLSIALIKGHYTGKQSALVKSFSLIPSGVFLLGVFFIQTYFLNRGWGLAFYQSALIYSIGLFIILWLAAAGIRKLFLDWEWRIELKIMLSFLQIVLAMFLPLVLLGLRTHEVQLGIDIKATIVTFLAMALIMFIGYIHKRYLGRHKSAALDCTD